MLAGWVVVGPLSFMSTLDKLKVTNRLAILCVLMVAALVVAYALDLIGFIHADLDACLGVELGEGREQCRGETHLAIMNMDTVRLLQSTSSRSRATRTFLVRSEPSMALLY